MQAKVAITFVSQLVENKRIGVHLVASVVLYAVTLEGLVRSIGGANFGKGERFKVVQPHALIKIEG